jgi:hypothetical protein
MLPNARPLSAWLTSVQRHLHVFYVLHHPLSPGHVHLVDAVCNKLRVYEVPLGRDVQPLEFPIFPYVLQRNKTFHLVNRGLSPHVFFNTERTPLA